MDYTILIIDDDELMHVLLGKLLGNEYQLIHAKNAQKGINIISEKPVNLILSDIHMPGLSGLEFLESLMQDADKKDIPVLIMTNLPTVEKEQKALDLGAGDFIDKTLFNQDTEDALNRIRMKLVTAVQGGLDEKLKVDKKKIGKILMAEAISGDFFTASRKLLREIRKIFNLDFISFWTISNTEPNLILCIGDLQPAQYGGDELKKEQTYQRLLEERTPYLTNRVSDEEGTLASFSQENDLPAEIGIPLFKVDEKTLLKNKFNMPKGSSLFGYIVLKRNKLFSEKEYKVLHRLLMQTGTILWRLYRKM